MAKNKAVFYYNAKDSSGNVYMDLQTRVDGWTRAVTAFLGAEDYDVLVVPVIDRTTSLELLPYIQTPIVPDAKLLNESKKSANTSNSAIITS